MSKKPSFFERLTGSVTIDDEDSVEIDNRAISSVGGKDDWMEEETEEGQLTVDVYQTPDDIIVKTMVAGVKPENLDISITREMVTIKGKRIESKETLEEDYFFKELYWGSFSRAILLPEEVDPETSKAVEKNGLLTITLPKIDRKRTQQIKVRSS